MLEQSLEQSKKDLITNYEWKLGALEKELKAPKWRSAWARRQAGIDPPLPPLTSEGLNAQEKGTVRRPGGERKVITAAQAARDATNYWIGTLDTTQTTRYILRVPTIHPPISHF